MIEKEKNIVPISALTFYSAMLYAVWTVTHFFIIPLLNRLSSEASAAFLENGIIKNLIWTLPAVVLITKNKSKMFVDLKEMLKWRKECNKYLLIFPIFAAYIILGIIIRGETISIRPEFCLANVITVLFVGITEEFVFRGWLLNSTVKYNENIAIAVNALMFLAIHFPKWIVEGSFTTNFTSFGFVSIIALSVVFSLIFIKTKNIILPIALHMFWDLLIFMLY